MAADFLPTPGNPKISWPIERTAASSSSSSYSAPNGDPAIPAITTSPGWRPARPAAPAQPGPPLDPSNYPGGPKSLSGISLRAFLLGTTFGICSLCAIYLSGARAPTPSAVATRADSTVPHPLWRVPFFLSSLSLFHFLEYYITARHNTRHASISAFLLTQNGWAYALAHTSALVECLVSQLWLQGGSAESMDHGDSQQSGRWSIRTDLVVAVGLMLMVVGQVVRSLAMVQAGTNFNHTVQVKRKQGHSLVKTGVYSVLRHPSYFGFFWWGLGTQLVLGNWLCLVGYAVVLWRFFNSRIESEEKFLIQFFGDEYVNYRKTAWIGIPGIH